MDHYIIVGVALVIAVGLSYWAIKKGKTPPSLPGPPTGGAGGGGGSPNPNVKPD